MQNEEFFTCEKPRTFSFTIDLSSIPLQCVRTKAQERGWSGHFQTFAALFVCLYWAPLFVGTLLERSISVCLLSLFSFCCLIEACSRLANP